MPKVGSIGAAALCLLIATGQAESSPAARELRVAIAADIRSTEVPTKHDSVTQTVLSHILEGLVAYRDDLTVGPLLAESVSVSDDGKTYEFTLRRGLSFHNGNPVDAAAVKWTWDRYLDPEINWGGADHCREIFDGSFEAYTRPVTVLAVEAPDERRVVFRLLSPNALFLHWMSSNYCLTGIFDPASVNPDGSWNAPIGTGPFKLKEWRKGAYVELERFADYKPRSEPRTGWTGMKAAGVDTLRFEVMPDPHEAKAALVSGSIDAWVDVPREPRRELESASNVRLHAQATPAWHMLLIQTRADPLLRDVRIRKAIAHAIDRERVAREATDSFAAVNPSAVATVSPFYSAVHKTSLGHDKEKAKALLTEAGYDGRLLRIHSNRDVYPTFHLAALSMRDMLREVGFNVEIEELTWAEQARRYANNDFQLSSMTYSMRSHPTLMYSAIIGQKTDHKWYLWEDLEADLWVARSVFARSDAERQELFDQLHLRMLEITPLVGIYNLTDVDAIRDGVTGYAPWALGLPRFWGVSKQ